MWNLQSRKEFVKAGFSSKAQEGDEEIAGVRWQGESQADAWAAISFTAHKAKFSIQVGR